MNFRCSTEAHPTESGDYIDYFLPIDGHKSITDRLSAAGLVYDITIILCNLQLLQENC